MYSVKGNCVKEDWKVFPRREERRVIFAKSPERCTILVVVALVAINATLLGAIIVTSKRVFKVMAARGNENEAWICLPCDRLRFGPRGEETDISMFHKQQTKNKKQIFCCATNASQSSNLLQLYLHRKLKERRAQGGLSRPHRNFTHHVHKPAALLLIDSASRDRHAPTVDGLHTMRDWTYRREPGYMVHGMRYDTGRLVVPHSGLYYIYSQVHILDHSYRYYQSDVISASGKRKALIPPETVEHAIYKYNVVYPGTGEHRLIGRKQSYCHNTTTPYVEQSSYIGSIQHLNAGDELFVRVSNISLIFRNTATTYFGVAMI